jgi:hypothetical protein
MAISVQVVASLESEFRNPAMAVEPQINLNMREW